MSDKEFFEFLKKNQLAACAEHSIPEEGMGSRVDAFSNGSVLLRVVVDRGQRFIDLARVEADVWIDVFTLALRIDPELHIKTGSFSEAVQVLTKYWTQLVTLKELS